jgi:hypothetical protein
MEIQRELKKQVILLGFSHSFLFTPIIDSFRIHTCLAISFSIADAISGNL